FLSAQGPAGPKNKNRRLTEKLEKFLKKKVKPIEPIQKSIYKYSILKLSSLKNREMAEDINGFEETDATYSG
ncbi:MAG: hypothetical protein M3421_02880, partial [Bacteroidota bacterium]|nr:hypothetical protein [Bacteroidota bacterium]